ncbi:hypothetical protein [Flavobacterium facile]|uniref:hypothetical protein n=1 Tax=Flavobacterium facile TaxID=2893174 RepID=UPI002E7744DA|nr:hypothetical protein [Flavobacterium sp. T-12]
MQTNDKKAAIIYEIQSQILQINLKLPKIDDVTEYVKLLSEKRQLQELLNQETNAK